MVRKAVTCPACGSRVPPQANFCPSCGQRLSEDEAAAYTHSPPRLFGVASPGALFVLGCALLLGALVALVAGGLVLGIVLLAASGALFVLFYGAAERDPDSAVSRGVLTAKERLRGWTSFTTGSASAWTKAGRDLVQLRRELRALRRERAQVRVDLGDAAYREDEAALTSLRARMRELDDAIAEREKAKAEALTHARRRVEDERVAVHQTEVIPPEEAEETRESTES